MNDFKECLDLSHSMSDQAWWEICYRKAFPTMIGMYDHRQDGDHQRAGIDRSIVLSTGKTLWIDEKVRAKDYGDIALEEWSVFPTKEGWVLKPLLADYIAYAIIPTRMCYLLPVVQLQAAWRKNERHWKRADREIRAQNKTYVTVSWAVPIKELYLAIGSMLRVGW